MSGEKGASVWHVSFIAPPGQGAPFAAVLERFADGVSYLEIKEDGPLRVECWSPEPIDLDTLTQAVTAAARDLGITPPDVSMVEEAPRDWLAENLASFQPLTIGRFRLCPTHHKETPAPRVVDIRLDAGLAFGTGEHASTAGCLAALDGLVDRYHFENVLDMGAGSGILGIAAAKAFGASVLAAEIDRRAVQVCAENAALNGVSDRLLSIPSRGYVAATIRDHGPYDLIFANILCRPLCTMARDLARHLAPGGYAILSGFLVRDAQRVFNAHRMQGLVLDDMVTRNGWRTLVLRKPKRKG